MVSIAINNKGYALIIVTVTFSVVLIFASSIFFIASADARTSRIRAERLQLEHSAMTIAEALSNANVSEIPTDSKGVFSITFEGNPPVRESFTAVLETIDESVLLTITASYGNLSHSHTIEIKE